MSKNKREAKREKQEREAAEREAMLEALARRRRTMRAMLIAMPIVTVALAAATYFAGDENTSLAAMVGLLGVGLWIPLLLGFVGGSVKPRDRTRAGSIDFGNRR